MSPIRITPQVPICVSKERGPSMPVTIGESFVATEEVNVRLEGEGLHYDVKVHGFNDGPGGILESERITEGYAKDRLILTTRQDTQLSKELGLSQVTIDGVIYTAEDLVDL